MLCCSAGIAFADHFQAYDSRAGGKVGAFHPSFTTNFLFLDGHVERHAPAYDSQDRLDATRKTMESIGYGGWK
jgi:prepilin-type processing-associated H-X9-DG protein